MSLKAMYNQVVAKNYDIADRFGAITESHNSAIAQIQKESLHLHPDYKVLDLGVGNGGFLKKLKPYMPEAHFTGIDISTEMLTQAQEALNLITIEANAAKASHYLPQHSQDLVLAHFINAYIPIKVLFNEAAVLAKANGYFSMITTTYDSFPLAQQHLAHFIAKGGLLSGIVGHYYKSVTNNTCVAPNLDVLLKSFVEHQFSIVAHKRLVLPITIKDIDELVVFGIDGTWFLNTTTIKILPKKFLIERLKRLFSKIFTFPYHDTHIIDIVLAKK